MSKSLIIAALAVGLFTLPGCTNGQVDATKIASVEASVDTVLTAAEQASCKAQTAANAANKAATALGDTDAANNAATASVFLGFGCTWAAVPATAS